MGMFGGWDVVAVTAETGDEARAFQAELCQRRELGALPGVTKGTILLAVPDPHPRPEAPWDSKSTVVGSGGATLNAVLAVAEQLSARNGTGTLDATVLQSKRVCILHSSSTHRIPAASCVGKAFSPLPAGLSGSDPSMPGHGLACNIDLILLVLQSWVGDAPPGVWVCSTEPFLNLPASAHRCAEPIAWTDGITAIALPASVSTGTSHGVYKINAGSKLVERILYRASEDELVDAGVVSKSATVPVVAPIVRFSADAAELLLGLYACAPLDGCTYYGYDAGGSATPVNLYLDILGACCAGASFEEYCKPPTAKDAKRSTPRLGASTALARSSRTCAVGSSSSVRELLWKTFHQVSLTATFPPGMDEDDDASSSASSPPFAYVTNAAEHLEFLTSGPLWDGREDGDGLGGLLSASRTAHASVDGSTATESTVASPRAPQAPGTVILNSSVNDCDIAEGCVVEHCSLAGCTVGEGSLVSGVDASNLTVPSNTVLHLARLQNGATALVRYGVHDDLTCVPPVLYCGKPWAPTAEESDGLWPERLPDEKRSIYYARLFESSDGRRISLAECVFSASVGDELSWRRDLGYRVDLVKIRQSLSNSGVGSDVPCLLSTFSRIALNRDAWVAVLNEMDAITSSFADQPHLVARALASQADMLAAFAGVEGGLRSGPARNEAWMNALQAVRTAPLAEAVTELATVRDGWLDSPERLMRAARHYEAAAAQLIARCVSTCTEFITATSTEAVPVGRWVTTTAPARIDLAGGWTDTPPVSYEFGGTVVNAAIKVDGQHPLEARVRRIDTEAVIRFWMDGTDEPVTVREKEDIADYGHPLAPAALSKTGVLCMGLIDLNDPRSLAEQLADNLGGGGAIGLEVVTASRLPMGSGLGGSSILGGTLLQALGTCVGQQYDRASLVHAVLKLEQMLSSGGGWQDQVGGLYGGFKVCHSAAQLPLKVETQELSIPQSVIDHFNDHLVLCYSGTARLARNLLQGVLRRWFARLPEVVDTVSNLVSNAEAIQPAVLDGDVTTFGQCVSNYWSQKKLMAGDGVEPTLITRALAAMAPRLAGYTLAGAGGGGFVLLVTKEPRDREGLQAALDTIVHTFTLHGARPSCLWKALAMLDFHPFILEPAAVTPKLNLHFVVVQRRL